MYWVTKQLRSVSAAHRLGLSYQGKCQHLHGHNYRITVTLARSTLSECGFVVDFSWIQQHFDRWLQQHWDHATLVASFDKPLLAFCRQQQQKHYVLEENTTAEHLARYLHQQFSALIPPEWAVQLIRLEVHESEHSSAVFCCDPE